MRKPIKDKTTAAKTPSYLRNTISRYQKKSVKRISVVFYTDNDSELIEKIESVKNMSGYLKGLIRSDIDSHPSEPLDKNKSLREDSRYSKSDQRRVSFLVNLTTSADLVTRIEAQDNLSQYIKALINADIS